METYRHARWRVVQGMEGKVECRQSCFPPHGFIVPLELRNSGICPFFFCPQNQHRMKINVSMVWTQTVSTLGLVIFLHSCGKFKS